MPARRQAIPVRRRYWQTDCLDRELPKNGDVPKSPLPLVGSLDAVGRREILLKNRPWFISRIPPALAFLHIRARWRRAF